MRVSLIKKNKITNLTLPERISGSYWIRDYDQYGIIKNLISIESDNNKWKLLSNKDVFYVKDDLFIDSTYLEYNKFYTIKNTLTKNNLTLFTSITSDTFLNYDIENIQNEITIGSKETNLIKLSTLEPIAAIIKKVNDKYYICDNNSKCGIYLDNVRIRMPKQIKVGDLIFINGIRIIFNVSNDLKSTNRILSINNFNNKNIIVSLMPSNINNVINNEFKEPDNEIEMPLYEESQFFHKMPRFIHPITPLKLKIDAPPAKQSDAQNPFLLTIGPMLTMAMTSVVSLINTFQSVSTGQTTMQKAMPSIIIAGAMIASVFIWPLITNIYMKHVRKKQESKRLKKYSDYISIKQSQIVEAKKTQTNSLKTNYPDTLSCLEVISNKYANLWNKRIEDEDFLTLNLGNGTYEMKINIDYPEDHFTLNEDKLKNVVSCLNNEPKLLENVPVTYSLYDNYISGLIGNSELINSYINQLLIQIFAFHSYADLKIVILTDNEHSYNWEYIKCAPHLFTDNKELRLYAETEEEKKEVCYYLERIFKQRQESSNNQSLKKENINNEYLIITDNFKRIRNFDIIKDILDADINLGFSLLILDDKVTNLPDQTNSFITINKENGECHLNKDYNQFTKFNYEIYNIDYEAAIQKISNIPIETSSSDETDLPTKVGFLEMYDVGKIEQLNCIKRWKDSNPILNLSAPVGIGKNKDLISIDLHEKYHGPHGLIAGMTGSGKSEFIITYILSMAINYHPYEVQFILIDYKGGGLAGAFQNIQSNLKLPHLVGTITNLDANEIKRSLASIDSELKKRQELFNQAREISGESTIDIYKYQKMFRDGLVKEPISHLFIISDEFAELKSQQPEFMQQLISTARIGRSLGVHLILATQKPSGVVDPQIWSNTRFRVCLRVQEKGDSNEVIKSPDAAYLKQTGRFYFQVGYNEVFTLGQAAWAGGKYTPSEKVVKNIDTSINFINNIGYQIKNIDTKVKQVAKTSNGEELLNIVKYLSNIAKQENIVTKSLWLEKIPDEIRIENLASKYEYKTENGEINPIIGEYDIPTKQQQCLLTLPITKEGNTLVYSSSGEDLENFATTLIYSSMLYYTPEEINYYLLDFGSMSLSYFNNSPIVGDILTIDSDEKISNLYKMISGTIESRKKLFQDYNGNIKSYVTNSNKKIPSLIIIINNYEAYQEAYEKFEDILVNQTRDSNRYGIYFVLLASTPNGIKFKLKQNFGQIFALNQNNDEDYNNILGNVGKNYPAQNFGRGIFKNDMVYEFQTAIVTERESIAKFIKDSNKVYLEKYKSHAISIPVLPDEVTYKEISSSLENDHQLTIGIDKDTLNPTKLDVHKNFVNIITGLDIFDFESFINNLINQIILKKETQLLVLNSEELNIEQKYTKFYNYINNNYDKLFNDLMNYIESNLTKYKANSYDKSIFKDLKPYTIIIIGIDSFKSRLSDENKAKFQDLFLKSKDLDLIDFIIVDSIDRIKKIELESWYKQTVNNNFGIWIGNGINDQFTLKVNQKIPELKMIVPNNFCFVIKRGKPIYVKYVTKLDLKV